MVSLDNSTKLLKKNEPIILHNLFHKIEEEGTISNKKSKVIIISLTNIVKNPQQNVGKQNSACVNRIIKHYQMGFIPGLYSWFDT